jgi:hypothetical protein
MLAGVLIIKTKAMKKFLICLIAVTFGVSCSKETGTIICGCSPVSAPEFSLIIKDKNNTDLLDQSKAGSFDKSQIKITYKEAEVTKEASFTVRTPFSYGEGLKNKFEYHQLVSTQMGVLRASNKAQEFYIDLGKGTVDTLTFDFDQTKYRAENVKINGVLQSFEPSLPEMYGKIYFLLK